MSDITNVFSRSKALKDIKSAIDDYITAMAKAGKPPASVTLTAKQRRMLDEQGVDLNKARYRGVKIK